MAFENQFSVRVPNALEALMLGEQAYTGAQQDIARKQAQDDLISGNTRSALARLIGANDPRMVQALGAYETAANTVYGTPIYGKGPNGEDQIGTFDKSGKFRPIDTGNFQPTPGIKTIETPQGTYVVGSKSGAPLGGPAPVQGVQPAPSQPQQSPGFYPADNRGKARDVKLGGEEGEKAATLGQAKTTLDSAVANIDRLSDAVKSISNDPALGKITGIQGVFPNWPGGRAANVQARLDNVTSQAGFAVLQAMRDASKTGGALGQVSDYENRQLQNNLAALSRAQDEKQYREQLQKIVEWGEGVKQRLQAAFDQDYARLPKPNQQPTTQAPQPTEMRTINGKNYGKVGNQWFEW